MILMFFGKGVWFLFVFWCWARWEYGFVYKHRFDSAQRPCRLFVCVVETANSVSLRRDVCFRNGNKHNARSGNKQMCEAHKTPFPKKNKNNCILYVFILCIMKNIKYAYEIFNYLLDAF